MLSNFKKIVTLGLSMFLVSLLLFGCSGNQTTSDPSKQGDQVEYPKKNIQIIVPFAPGGQTDVSGRVVAQHLQKHMGVPVVVVNQEGGSGSVAMETVRTAEPDGYTLLYYHEMLHTAKHTGKYQYGLESLTPIATLAAVDQVYMVRSDSSWQNLQELVDYAKQHPHEIKVGLQLGGTSHFMGALLCDAAGIDLHMVDIGAESERIAAIKGKQIDLIITSVSNALNYAAAGDLRPLAVLSSERSPLAPDWPTAKELGVDMEWTTLHALYGPKDLPEEIVSVLDKALGKMIEDPEFLKDLDKIKQTLDYRDSAQATKFLVEEEALVERLAKTLGF